MGSTELWQCFKDQLYILCKVMYLSPTYVKMLFDILKYTHSSSLYKTPSSYIISSNNSTCELEMLPFTVKDGGLDEKSIWLVQPDPKNQ